MTYVPPANRSNGTIKWFQSELYVLPKSDKTGILTDLTKRANEILKHITYKYQVGMRVYAVSAMRQPVHGQIISANHNIGINEYAIRDDNGKLHIIAENGIKFVLSLVLGSECTQITLLAA